MATDTPAPLPAAQPTPMKRLWQRYLKARGSRIGLVLVTFFGLIAFFAPFLAHRLPFFWHNPATGAISFPLLREFLAPSDTTEPLLEKGVNFLLVFLPLALLAWRLLGKYFPALSRRESRAISLLFGALFTSLLWLSIGSMVVQGGGRDWLYQEAPPVPDIDDIRTPSALFGAADAKIDLSTVDKRLGEHGFSFASSSEGTNTGVLINGEIVTDIESDEFKRRFTAILQQSIEGNPIGPVSAFAGIESRDITDDNLDLGINAFRWNRMLVEHRFPGLLVPMRQFRSSFVAVAVASLLVLLGLTYIFIAGANQFVLSPRWLILLALALAVSLPFRIPSRHDHTPYRELAAAGKGTGLFPPIPYGPNEQGFGPRLPPTWYADAAVLDADDIVSWSVLKQKFADNAFLRQRLGDDADAASAAADQATIVASLNRLVHGAALYDAERHERYTRDMGLGPYLTALHGGRTLGRGDTDRLNRLLLEKELPGALHPARVNSWKRPTHNPAYHFLGTDESGRDVLVRVIHGARVSLSVGFVSIFLSTVIGLVLGALAAYYGRWVDMLISRFIEIMMCFPSFFLILAVIAVLEQRSIVNIMLVIGLTSWTGVARLVRGEMLRQKKMDYVAASVALGAPDVRTIFRHILPNAMAPVLVSISFGITGAILTEASLSFIGFGVTPPTPTWGQLLSETRESPLANWWLAVFPGLVLFFSVVAYNLVGEALRDALDPRTSL